jgi:hypothetical protein
MPYKKNEGLFTELSLHSEDLNKPHWSPTEFPVIAQYGLGGAAVDTAMLPKTPSV